MIVRFEFDMVKDLNSPRMNLIHPLKKNYVLVNREREQHFSISEQIGNNKNWAK